MNQTKQQPNEDRLFRGPVTRDEREKTIDRTGGNYGAGVIRNMAVITRGEALGHDVWCDSEFLASIVEASEDNNLGVKSHLTHGDMSADGIAKGLGRTNSLFMDGDIVRGDLHFFRSAHKSPEGNLADFIMTRTAEDYKSLGASITFKYDRDAETEFAIEHGATVDDFGNVDYSKFQSPDSQNTKNLPHARLAVFRGVDIVDDPAANPSGMFSRDTKFSEAEKLLSYVLGESSERPELTTFDVDPDRVASFFTRYLSNRGLIMAKDKPTSEAAENQNLSEAPQEENVSKSQPEEKPAETPTEQSEAPKTETPSQEYSTRSEVKRYIAAFGEQGASWYADGLTYAEGQEKLLGIQRQEIEQLQRKLKHQETSDAAGLSSGGSPEQKQGKRSFADLISFK